MKRREFMTLLSRAVVAAWPLTARAQQTAPLIGFLISGAADSFAIFVDAFRHGMRDHGMIEGRDYVLDLRYADGNYGRFQALAAELLERKPAVIVVTTISAARAAQRATSTIPIVMTGLIDPVGQGLIASLARPGGNTTGLANLAQDVMPKLVEVLRGTFPAIKDIALLFNPANPANRELSKAMPVQAGAIGVTVRLVEFTTVGGLDGTFAALARQPDQPPEKRNRASPSPARSEDAWSIVHYPRAAHIRFAFRHLFSSGTSRHHHRIWHARYTRR